MLRYWFGPDLEVLDLVEHDGVEGVPGDTSPGLASQQLALSIEAAPAQTDPPVKGGEAAEGNP